MLLKEICAKRSRDVRSGRGTWAGSPEQTGFSITPPSDATSLLVPAGDSGEGAARRAFCLARGSAPMSLLLRGETHPVCQTTQRVLLCWPPVAASVVIRHRRACNHGLHRCAGSPGAKPHPPASPGVAAPLWKALKGDFFLLRPYYYVGVQHNSNIKLPFVCFLSLPSQASDWPVVAL